MSNTRTMRSNSAPTGGTSPLYQKRLSWFVVFEKDGELHSYFHSVEDRRSVRQYLLEVFAVDMTNPLFQVEVEAVRG